MGFKATFHMSGNVLVSVQTEGESLSDQEIRSRALELALEQIPEFYKELAKDTLTWGAEIFSERREWGYLVEVRISHAALMH